MRRMLRADLEEAVAHKRLLHGPSGWIVAEDEDDDTMFVPLLVATDGDAYRMVRAVVDRADRREYSRVRALVPSIEWMTDALARGGFDLSVEQVWAKTVA